MSSTIVGRFSRRDSAIVAGAILAIAASVLGIWRGLRPAGAFSRALHEGVGMRAAEEVARRLDGRGRIVVVTLDAGASEALDAQVRAFGATLGRWPGIEVVATDTVDPGKGSKYGPGTGMSARRWAKLSAKHPDASLVVSFLGGPDPGEVETAGRDSRGPRLVAVCRSPREVARLFERGILAFALVPRFVFPAPGPDHPRTPAEWFENRYQVVTPDMARP